MDNLEKFIKDNRESFDSEIPNLKIWAAIDSRVNEKDVKRVRLFMWVRRIAAAAAILAVGICLGIYLDDKKGTILADQNIASLATEYKEAAQYYDQQVQDRLVKLASYNPDPSVMMDIQMLDAIQKELEAELKNAPTSAREEIIERMINNYKIKLGILERVLEHIEKHKSDNQENNQKVEQHESI